MNTRAEECVCYVPQIRFRAGSVSDITYGMNARKCALASVWGIVIAWTTVQGNQLAPATSLSVSAKEIGSTGATAYRWMTSWGSYDRDFFTQQDVQIEAHNLSRLPARILINFYFVGQPEHKSEPRKLFSERSFTIDVPPAYQKRISLGSDVLQSNEQRYVALGEQYNSGYHLVGWLLEATVPNDPKPFAYASSNPSWIERLDWFDRALAEFHQQASVGQAKAAQQPNTTSPSNLTQAPSATPAITSRRRGNSGVPAPASNTPTSVDYVVTTTDITLRVEYGEVVIRRGTRLRVIKRDATTVYVQFGNTPTPLSSEVVQ